MSLVLDLPAVVWIKSSHSDADGGNCLEFSRSLIPTHGVVPVRDSKSPGGPMLAFPVESWVEFVSAVGGE